MAGEGGGTNGTTTLQPSDSDITALANANYGGTPDNDYVLVVRDDANDTVEFAGSGIAKTGDTPALVEYTATDGIIYVNPEVTVDL